MQKVYKAIGARIRALRQGLKMTQAEVAERAGIDASFYGQLERGANTPSLRTLYSVASVLQVEPAELLPKARAAKSDDPLMTEALSSLLKRLRPERRKFLLGVVRDLADELKR